MDVLMGMGLVWSFGGGYVEGDGVDMELRVDVLIGLRLVWRCMELTVDK